MAMVETLRANIESFKTTTPEVQVDYLGELMALLHTLGRWQKHPFRLQMVRGLFGEHEYQHTVILLAAATAFEDAGNNVEFKAPGPQRTPDLFLVIGPQDRIAVEVKAPKELRGRSAALGRAGFQDVVKAAMKRAGTGGSGQLSRAQSGMLVIGSFRTWPSDVKDFEAAATDYLRAAATRGKHRHLLSIVLLSFVTIAKRGPTQQSAQPALLLTNVEHPGYQGTIKLRPSPPAAPPVR
jgi:hypothetical protein